MIQRDFRNVPPAGTGRIAAAGQPEGLNFQNLRLLKRNCQFSMEAQERNSSSLRPAGTRKRPGQEIVPAVCFTVPK